MSRSEFAGVWTAIATPFLADLSIDWASYEQLLASQRSAGVTGIVVSGTTGEAPTLSAQEKSDLLVRARRVLGSDVRLMAGAGSNDTAGSIAACKEAVAAGADSLLIVTPPYNKPSPDGLYAHYQAIAESTEVPLCLYHVPGRTAHLLSPEVIAKVCSIESVKLVKEASADIALFSRAQNQAKAVFVSGDDPTYLASLAVGGQGCISVVSNVFPKAMVTMTKSFWQGDHEKARSIHDALLPFIDSLFCETNPCPLKAALAVATGSLNTLRLPLVPVSEKNQTLISNLYHETRDRLAELVD